MASCSYGDVMRKSKKGFSTERSMWRNLNRITLMLTALVAALAFVENMSVEVCDVIDDHPNDTFKILIATDSHLGFAEKDPERSTIIVSNAS